MPRLEKINDTAGECHVSSSECYRYEMLLARARSNGMWKGSLKAGCNFG